MGKKASDSSKTFDIPMGSLDEGEVTDLVGLYMLYLLRTILGDRVKL